MAQKICLRERTPHMSLLQIFNVLDSINRFKEIELVVCTLVAVLQQILKVCSPISFKNLRVNETA